MGIAVVVGGGCSGVFATRELLRAGWQVVLVDPGARPGRGLAYGTADPWHLLNSPVAAMSADPDRPEEFLDWCRARAPRTAPGDFVPRTWYGDYLTDTLLAADRGAPGRLTVQRGRVARIFDSGGTAPGRLTVLLTDDVVINADHVVLALGHPAPGTPARLDPALNSSPAYLADPWRPGALAALPEGPVLLIGTGLTAVDVALTLSRTGRHHALTAVSRHGLLPQPHRRPGVPGAPVDPADLAALPVGSPAALVRALRELATRTGDWRAVMDALRPRWDTLWQGLSEPDQHRFLRHLARYWEVHRHRMAPPIADTIDGLLAHGTLTVTAAELCGLAAEDSGVRAVLRERRTGAVVSSSYAAVVNCTGPGRLVESDRLVRSLIADGMARPGPHRLGLDTDASGAVLRRDGSTGRTLWTLGPTRRGRLWETTAAPEIRAQARTLALAVGTARVAVPVRVDS
ncbi:hydroxyacylglutathione hydrolase [Catellatospora sp. TT07R-123]|uniref:FAD/NAD(P)-binding protein n=1 Tax=Catellatospora sp. TT07R-123 TaxID=2733863 RepID=UPI001B2736D3|nr:FAD/NAD(P)-binding protein [Catellatospora sp. TT07R-123]GHJ50198.1 hydroxyacylglutathione hydrolase [Catellatospora sp. TT07R-123]